MMDEDKNIEQDLEVFEDPGELTSTKATKMPTEAQELVLATIQSVDPLGQFKVLLEDADEAVSCMATFNVTSTDIGRQVALMFINADQTQPIAIGLIRSQLDRILELHQHSDAISEDMVVEDESDETDPSKKVVVDGESIKIEGQEEIVLKCGESSITLNKNGKITIRGKYLLNRSSGVNRIMGGSVQLN